MFNLGCNSRDLIKTNMRYLSLKGRRLFQAISINMSYRNRGRVARNHTQMMHIIKVIIVYLIIVPLTPKNHAVNAERTIIIPYSAIKITANRPPPYSILKPDTSSDSPSEKSKGVRLVSATQDTSHTPNSGINRKNLLLVKITSSWILKL